MLRLLLVVLLLVISVTLAGAPQADKPPNALPDLTPRVAEPKAEPKFRVEMVTDDDEVDLDAASYIKRELRSLGDVEIVYEGAEWKLQVLANEDKTKSGRKIGYSIAVAFTRRIRDSYPNVFDYNELRKLLSTDVVFDFVEISVSYEFQSLYLGGGGTAELDLICKNLVTTFDIKHLEPERKKRVENVR